MTLWDVTFLDHILRFWGFGATWMLGDAVKPSTVWTPYLTYKQEANKEHQLTADDWDTPVVVANPHIPCGPSPATNPPHDCQCYFTPLNPGFSSQNRNVTYKVWKTLNIFRVQSIVTPTSLSGLATGRVCIKISRSTSHACHSVFAINKKNK